MPSTMRETNSIVRLVENARIRNPAIVPIWQISRIGLRPNLSDSEPHTILPNKLKNEFAESSKPTCSSDAPYWVENWGRKGIKIEYPMISMKVEIYIGMMSGCLNCRMALLLFLCVISLFLVRSGRIYTLRSVNWQIKCVTMRLLFLRTDQFRLKSFYWPLEGWILFRPLIAHPCVMDCQCRTVIKTAQA